ncbi:hypothetical protein [Methanoculleus chikugoensis]|uniref:hypothetical protein n=1 Tax=Methanoculleus chikugoensis TaxID=118126 RepID=UPI000B2ABD52|nr:hypothetical protein [Methanoculleus chikugoensis]
MRGWRGEALLLANRKLNLLSDVTRHDILNRLTVLTGYLALFREQVSDPELLEYCRKEEEAIRDIQRYMAFTAEYRDVGVTAPPPGGISGGSSARRRRRSIRARSPSRCGRAIWRCMPTRSSSGSLQTSSTTRSGTADGLPGYASTRRVRPGDQPCLRG